MMIGVRGDVDDIFYKQERQDNIFNKVYDFEMEENEVTKDFQGWPEAEIFEFEELEERDRWIGTTRTLDCSGVAWFEAKWKLWQWSHDHNATEINDKMAMIGDWRPDVDEFLQTSWDWNPTSLEVEDWHLGWNEQSGHGLNFMKEFVNGTNYELIFDIAPTYVLAIVTMEWIASLYIFEFIDYTIMKVVFVLLAAMAGALVIQSKMKKEPKNMKGHLALRRNRKWNGTLRKRFAFRLQLKTMLLVSLWTSANAMEAEQAKQMFVKTMQMTEAATMAARASSAVMEKMEQRKDSGNFGEASKILKAPDSLEGDDPLRYAAWKEQFPNWLTYGDSRFADLLRDVEALDEPCQLSTFASEDVKTLAHRLYAILASYIKGPALQFIRAEATEKNGFLVWQQLKNLYMPKARPRTMAIGQAIMGLPSFPKDKSMMENLLQLDLLLDQYRLASGHPMPDDLVVSTVMRCVDINVRKRLELTMDDSLDYQQLKERLIVMDKNSRAWSGDTYLKMAPMEVDQVGQVKGKYKGKQKGKDKKGGGWFPYGFGGGKYGGKNSKGKSKKGKGKKGKKGKGKSQFNGKGKGGGQDRNTCRLCGQQGHWGNECPNRQRAQTVTNQNQTPNSVAESEIASSAGGKIRSGSSVASTTYTTPKQQVRQLRVYHVATPTNASSPIMFDIKSEGGDSWIYDDNYQINTVYFSLDGESEVDEQEFQHDKTWRWYMDAHSRRYALTEAELEPTETFYVCTVRESQQKTLIVLGSGADISLLPQSMAHYGRASKMGKAVLEDAQGGKLTTFGKKLAQIECDGKEAMVIIEDDFVVASVQSPLISLGRLLQRGWRLIPGSGEAGVHLQAPDGFSSIPLHFNRNSNSL